MSATRRRLSQMGTSLVGGLLVMATLTGCAPKAGTPEQAARNFVEALVQQDYRAAFTYLPDEQRSRLRDELVALGKDADGQALERLSRQFGLNLRREDLAGLSAEDFFVKAMAGARAGDKEFALLFSRPPKVVGDSAYRGQDTAEVQLQLGDGRIRVFRCVREGGDWRVMHPES